MGERVANLGVKVLRLLKRFASSSAAGPLTRTIATEPTPCAVAIATTVFM